VAAKDPRVVYVSNIEHEQARTAIEQLPMEFREIILLHEYEGFSFGETATLLDCPEGTVISRLAKARSKLRDSLIAISKAHSRE
jgi:RNA polymerase sigma-70 factor, ECF subfamily